MPTKTQSKPLPDSVSEPPGESDAGRVGGSDATAFFDRGESYRADAVAETVGVPVSFIADSVRAGELPARKTRQGAIVVRGGDLLAWLEKHHVLQRAAAIREGIAQQQAAADNPVPAPLSQALADRDREAEAFRCEEEKRLWDKYRQLMLRGESLSQEDADALVDLAGELGLSSEQVAEDARIIARARRYQGQWDGRKAARARSREAVRAKIDLERLVRDQLADAKAKAQSAHTEAMRCDRARDELASLARRRPELFDAGDPPRLRGIAGDG